MRDNTEYNLKIGKIFIKEYNNIRGTNYSIPRSYKDKGQFPDIIYRDVAGRRLKVEFARAFPPSWGSRIKSHDRLSKIFRQNRINYNIDIIIWLKRNVREINAVKNIAKDRRFLWYLKGKCEGLIKSSREQLIINSHFYPDMPLKKYIRQIELGKSKGKLQVRLIHFVTGILDFAEELETSVRQKLKRYRNRKLSEIILVLDGRSHPLLRHENMKLYIDDLRGRLYRLRASLKPERYFKEIWNVTFDPVRCFVEQVI